MFIAWALPIKALARRISKLGVPPAAPLQMRKESSFAEIISEDAKFVTQVTRVRTRLLCGVRLCRPDHEPMHASLSRPFIHSLIVRRAVDAVASVSDGLAQRMHQAEQVVALRLRARIGFLKLMYPCSGPD